MDKITCDVVVIGAGAAGIAAAVAARQLGLNVILIERYGFTGGLATAAMVGTICGVYYRSNNKNPRYAVQGFAKTFSQAVMEKSNTKPYGFAKGLHFIPYQPSAFHHQAVTDLQQAGVKLFLHAMVVDVKMSEKQIDELVVHTSDKVSRLATQAVIDCSGNAQVAMLSGLDRIEQSNYQSGAFVFGVSGLPRMELQMLALNLIRWIKQGIDHGDLSPYCGRLSIIPGTLSDGEAFLKLSMPEPFKSDLFNLSSYELEARSRSVEIIDHLRSADPLLAKLKIIAMATQIGIRTGPRHEGIDLLKENHILNCEKPDNGVAMGVWPIEYWNEQRKPDMSYFSVDDYYLIPAGTLVSKHAENLFFAGRTISATERAIASARVIGTCLSTGYAAGMLAAEYVNTGFWQTGVEKIRNKQIFSVEV